MKNVIVTFWTGELFRPVAELTIPFMRAYARRVGAELRVVTDPAVWADVTEARASLFYAKLPCIRGGLAEFERVLYVDADILITPSAPDLFKLVPPDRLGARIDVLQPQMIRCIRKLADKYKLPPCDLVEGQYFNAGLTLSSRAHLALFEKPPIYYTTTFGDQDLTNYRRSILGIPLHVLPPQLNLIVGFEKPDSETRILHFVGKKDRSLQRIRDFLKRTGLTPEPEILDDLPTAELFSRLGASPMPTDPARLLEVRVVGSGKVHRVEMRSRVRGQNAADVEPVYLSPARFATIKSALQASGLKMIFRPPQIEATTNPAPSFLAAAESRRSPAIAGTGRPYTRHAPSGLPRRVF